MLSSETSSKSDPAFNSKGLGEWMNELQENVFQDESLLCLSERNQEENEKIIGRNENSPFGEMLNKQDSIGILQCSGTLEEPTSDSGPVSIMVIYFQPLWPGSWICGTTGWWEYKQVWLCQAIEGMSCCSWCCTGHWSPLTMLLPLPWSMPP